MGHMRRPNKTKPENAMISVNGSGPPQSGVIDTEPARGRLPFWQNPKLQNEPNWDNSNDFGDLERMLAAPFAD
jgi:hypothetical protein